MGAEAMKKQGEERFEEESLRMVCVSYHARAHTGEGHIPADLVVTPRVSPYPLVISTWYPHDVSSVPTATRMEMRHGTDGQTTARKPNPHDRFQR